MSIGDLIQYKWFIGGDVEETDVLLILAWEESNNFYDITALDSLGKLWTGTMHELEFDTITLK